MGITKEAVEAVIDIAKLIRAEGLEGKNLNNSRYNTNYNKQIKPKLSIYKERYNFPPNKLLNNYLDQYVMKNSQVGDFLIANLHFVGQLLNSFTWACIYPKPKGQYSYGPQLYILINWQGIQFGFCYGIKVKDKDDVVGIVTSNPEIRQMIFDALHGNNGLKFSNRSKQGLLPSDDELIAISSAGEISTHWKRDSLVIDYYAEGKIPDDIETKIENCFDNLLPIFHSIASNKPTQLPEDAPQKKIEIPGVRMKFNEGLEYAIKEKSYKVKNLFFERDSLNNIEQQINGAIKSGNHIILIGPPGTGKSKLAIDIAETYCGEGNYLLATATSDWSPYETIGGYMLNNSSGKLEFQPGIFLQCFQDKQGEPINRWLIIDEINRSDIDKAFGALYSALAKDSVTLPFMRNGKQIEVIGNQRPTSSVEFNRYFIHPKWRIIATMNTFDKSSLYEMSYAFMRRFAFIHVDVPTMINEDLINSYLKIWNIKLNDDVVGKISKLWQKINEYRKIGPAIVQDLCQFVSTSGKNDLFSPLSMYVLPQFEGLDENDIKKFILSIIEEKLIDNGQGLIRFACEFYRISEAKFKKNDNK